ncbi:MAG: TrkA C-terminal domain-containing protein, partial [Clostridia bacterium]|nr:TrkA C-terminal domain-containing protein [Clostridia bacterium]
KKQSLQVRLKKQTSMSKMIENLCDEIFAENQNAVHDNSDIPIYEVKVPSDSWIIGKNLVDVRFWANTEATVLAVRRNGHLILSPGPMAELYGGDQVLFAGNPEAVRNVEAFLKNEVKLD